MDPVSYTHLPKMIISKLAALGVLSVLFGLFNSLITVIVGLIACRENMTVTTVLTGTIQITIMALFTCIGAVSYTHLLNNNFKNSDLMVLFSTFEQWDDVIQEKIFDLGMINITDIIEQSDDVSEKLKDKLIRTDQLSKGIRVDLLIAMMPVLDKDYIIEALALLDLSNYIKIFDKRSRPKFKISDESVKLLTAFKEKHLICNCLLYTSIYQKR